MSSLIHSYAIWLADYYLLSTVLLALALVAMTFIGQPAQRLAVAKSMLVGLLMLAILSAMPGWSVVHLLSPERQPPIVEPRREVAPTPAVASLRPESMKVDAQRLALPHTANLPLDEPSPTPSHSVQIDWPIVLPIAHLGGVACLASWLILGLLASARLRRSARQAPPDVIDVLNDVIGANRGRVRQLRLLVHDRIEVAVALGIWQPTILLPTLWTQNQSRNELRAVLAHESTHVLNHDLQWLAIARALFLALWAHPLFWIARRRLRLDQESLADAAAAEATDRQHYAEQLVAWARDVSRRPALHLSSAVGLWEGPSQLRQRITILLNERFTVLRNCSRRWRLAAASLAIGVATALSLVTIQPGRTAPTTGSDGKRAATPAAQTTGTLSIRFEFDGTPPSPSERKEWIWRAKLDNRELGRIDIEKEVGAKVFDESLVVGKDRGIANVFVWVRSRDIPAPAESNLAPVTLSYRKGRYEPHAIAFQAPRQLVFRNDDKKSTCNFNYTGMKSHWNQLVHPGEEKTVDVRPERVPARLAANILPWLTAWVLPLANPNVAVSDENGVARIKNLPPGKWEFQVWHERPGWLKTRQWPMGRFTLEIKPGDNDLGTVKVSPAVLHDTAAGGNESRSNPASDDRNVQNSKQSGRDSAHDEPDRRTSGKRDVPELDVVVAKNVMLLDGKQIITWDEIDKKIAASPNPSNVYPSFYMTHGVIGTEAYKSAKERIWELHRKYKLKGHNEGTLAARTSFRYDRIRDNSDLVPDPSLRVEGTVLGRDSKPVAGAEVILITPVDESLSYKAYDIAIVEGRVRNRLDEVVTSTDAAGRFAIYPPKGQKYFVVAMHPEHGFNLATDTNLAEKQNVQLIAWAALTSEFAPEPGKRQTASLNTRLPNDGGYPEASIAQYWSDLNREKPTKLFGFTHVPPIFQTSISRDFTESDGGSLGINAASVSLLPGEERRLDLGPLSEKQREHLKWVAEELKRAREQRRPKE